MGGLTPSAPGASGEGRGGGWGAGAICNWYRARPSPGAQRHLRIPNSPTPSAVTALSQPRPVTKLDVSAERCVNGEHGEAIDSLLAINSLTSVQRRFGCQMSFEKALGFRSWPDLGSEDRGPAAARHVSVSHHRPGNSRVSVPVRLTADAAQTGVPPARP